MAVAVDVNPTGVETESLVASLDISITPGAGSDMAIFCFAYMLRTGRTTASVVYDPGGADEANFTNITNIAGPNTFTFDMSAWRLLDADIVNSSAKTVRMNIDTSTSRMQIRVASFTGVDQTTPNDTASTAEDQTSGSMTDQSVTSATDDMVLDTCFVQSAAPTVGTGQTSIGGAAINTNGTHCIGSYKAGAASVTMDYDWSGNRNWSWIGFNVNAAGAASGAMHPFPVRRRHNAILMR